MPVFVHALLAWLHRRPVAGLSLLTLAGGLAYWAFAPPTPLPQRAVARAQQSLPGLGAERAVMEKTLLDVQKDNTQLRESLHAQERTLHQIQQALTAAEKERQAQAAAQEQRLDEALRRAQQQVRPATPPPAPRPAPPPRPVALPPPQPQALAAPPAPPSRLVAKVQILRHDTPPSFQGMPPLANREDTPYLPAGSFSEGRVITGVMASSRPGGALPVLFSVTKEFRAPWQLQGPGRHPLATALPVQGCFVLGKAQADLGSGRVLIQLDTLSCVMPDAATFERPLRGYATDVDGTLGIVGRIETRDTAILARTFLTSLLAGASEAFAQAKRTVIVTPFGGTTSAVTGNVGELAGFSALAHAAAQLSQYYLQQASQLGPVIWVESGTPARLVLQEGLELEGLSTAVTVQGALP